jgi:hypothetical protein
MPLHSSFAEFSLVECFRLVEQGRRTGRLAVSYAMSDFNEKNKYYFWFHQGRFIAASNTLEGNYLSNEIVRRGWLSQRVLEKLVKLSRGGRPLGLNLKLMGALQPDQIAALFGFQLRQLTPILEISDGEFQLDRQAPAIYSEMTGLSMGAMEVAVGGLRRIQHWKALETILPRQTSALQRWNAGEIALQLTEIETRVLGFANGRSSLAQISKRLGYGVDVVQQTALRLMIANLVDEISPLPVPPTAPYCETPSMVSQPKSLPNQPALTPLASTASGGSAAYLSNQALAMPSSSPKKPSGSFLRGIVDFLRSKV